ncbi:hypothetical protein D3C87_1223620 [compost metagenome]
MHAAAPRHGIRARRPGKGELESSAKADPMIRPRPEMVIPDSIVSLARCRTMKTSIAPSDSSNIRNGIMKYAAKLSWDSMTCEPITEISVIRVKRPTKNLSDTFIAAHTMNGHMT